MTVTKNQFFNKNKLNTALKNEESIYYSINIDPKSNSVALREHINGLREESITVIARNYSWRAVLVKKFCQSLCIQKIKGIKRLERNGNILSLDPINASRLFVVLKVLSSIKTENGANEILEPIMELPDGETAYWAWKIASNQKKAILAFKILHGGGEEITCE